jgi:hypothetical protein
VIAQETNRPGLTTVNVTTVTTLVAETPPTVPVIVVVPGAIAVTLPVKPKASIWAIDGSEDFHAIARGLRPSPAAFFSVASSCIAWPRASSGVE